MNYKAKSGAQLIVVLLCALALKIHYATASPDGFSVPFVFNQGNQTRMLVSCMKGDIYLYSNIDGNLDGNFDILDTVLSKTGGSRYGNNLSVSGGNLNNDTLTDLIIGFYGGGIQIYYQDNPTSTRSSANSTTANMSAI